MSRHEVVFFSQNVMVSTCGCKSCPSREREAYVLNTVDRSLVYGEVVYKVIRPGRTLCGSTTMSSLGWWCFFGAKSGVSSTLR